MEVLLAFLAGIVVCMILALFIFKGISKAQEDKFKVLASEILQKNSEQFQTTLMTPLKSYQDFIGETHDKDVKERARIETKISHMMQAAAKIEKEAHQLTKALSSDVKFQGDWGELTLEKILELSGLEKDREFSTQSHFEYDGKSLRPDVVVNLPDNTNIIIDSKVSLKAYFEYLDKEDDKKLKELKDSVKKHIDQLSDKKYQLIQDLNTPDFVYLFVPVEGVYSLILKNFPELIDESLKKNVILVAPMNLMANLKTVAALWRIDKQSKSASEIANKAGAMYDKFALLVEEMEKLGSSLNRTQNLFIDIDKKLHSGRGNLVDRAHELKEMGAKTSKNIQTH